MIEGLGRGRKFEVDEAVRLTGVAHLVDIHAVVPESARVFTSFIAQHIASAEHDQCRWEVFELICVQWCGVGVTIDVSISAVGGPEVLTRFAADDEPVELNRRWMFQRPRHARVHENLAG